MKLGVLSDAHGNLGGFRRAIRTLTSLGADSFVFLGDAIGYIPSPLVVRELMHMGASIRCIKGNHEHMLLSGAVSCNESVYQLRRTASMLNDTEIEFISSWPNEFVVESPIGTLLFIHGSPSDTTFGYVYPDTDLQQFACDTRFVFMGHTHRPFIREGRSCTFVNAGSCGLPRDNGGVGAAAILDFATSVAEIVRFDVRGDLQAALSAAHPVHPTVEQLLGRTGEAVGGVITDD